jgi:prolipoprotein diacylglyceryltransferase
MGAIVGAYVAGYIASKAIGKAGCACDAFAPALALGMAIGRIGDFLSGEDLLGKETTLPWGVHVPGVDYLVHPTPLYDAGFNLLWLLVLLLLRDNPKLQNGNLLKFGLAGYATFRFFVEFVRNNQVLALGLTGQQYVCLFLLAAVAWYFARQAGYFKPAATPKAG